MLETLKERLRPLPTDQGLETPPLDAATIRKRPRRSIASTHTLAGVWKLLQRALENPAQAMRDTGFRSGLRDGAARWSLLEAKLTSPKWAAAKKDFSATLRDWLAAHPEGAPKQGLDDQENPSIRRLTKRSHKSTRIKLARLQSLIYVIGQQTAEQVEALAGDHDPLQAFVGNLLDQTKRSLRSHKIKTDSARTPACGTSTCTQRSRNRPRCSARR